MAYTQLIAQEIAGGRVEEITPGQAYRLTIPAGPQGQYRLAQVDDYAKRSRREFPWRPPVSIGLSARVSSRSIPGTWGFGLWNYPFGMSLGFAEDGFRLPALPNTVWFFNGSRENYVSFRDDRPGSGFLAQSFRAPAFDLRLVLAGLALPFSRRTARRGLQKVIAEDGVRLDLDVTEWHTYQIEWRRESVRFVVDEKQIFESPVSPKPPLGLVIWIDNQYAAFTPDGKLRFGVLENPEPAMLEFRDLDIR